MAKLPAINIKANVMTMVKYTEEVPNMKNAKTTRNIFVSGTIYGFSIKSLSTSSLKKKNKGIKIKGEITLNKI